MPSASPPYTSTKKHSIHTMGSAPLVPTVCICRQEHLQLLSDVVAKEVNVLKFGVPPESRRGWTRTNTEISTQDLGDSWREDVQAGAKYVLQETLVKASLP
jgi:hypothetical protein